MLRIVLLCAGGVSTSFLANNMRKSARERGIETKIEAFAGTHIHEVINDADIFLLAPQARNYESEIRKACEENKKPFMLIDAGVYRMLNGAKLLDQAIAAYNKKQRSSV